jgi:hypothetical protein
MMFTRLDKSSIQLSDNGVVLDGGKCRHVQGGPHGGAPAADVTLAALISRVFGKWGETCQSADLFAVQAAQFGKRYKQTSRGVFARVWSMGVDCSQESIS